MDYYIAAIDLFMPFILTQYLRISAWRLLQLLRLLFLVTVSLPLRKKHAEKRLRESCMTFHIGELNRNLPTFQNLILIELNKTEDPLFRHVRHSLYKRKLFQNY